MLEHGVVDLTDGGGELAERGGDRDGTLAGKLEGEPVIRCHPAVGVLVQVADVARESRRRQFRPPLRSI
jgi:hypothetical protein